MFVCTGVPKRPAAGIHEQPAACAFGKSGKNIVYFIQVFDCRIRQIAAAQLTDTAKHLFQNYLGGSDHQAVAQWYSLLPLPSYH